MFDCDIVACLLPMVEPLAVADGLFKADGLAAFDGLAAAAEGLVEAEPVGAGGFMLDGLAASGAFGIVPGAVVFGEIGVVG
jgi:hypothetical protein